MAITPSVDLSAQGLTPEVFRAEAYAIADWWLAHAQDRHNGGYYGQIAWNNQPEVDAHKSIILNARILWFFSEFARGSTEPSYRAAAQRAYEYLQRHFIDQEYGGVVWMLDARGQTVDDRKHVYGQAFAIYGLCAYYDLTAQPAALDLALQLFRHLETHAQDLENGGYFEAFSRAWGPLEDVRLSEKDHNAPKTMNTHLHLMEAYTGLHKSVHSVVGHPQAELVDQALRKLLNLYCERIVDLEMGHVRLFMAADWRDCSAGYSFGHDIESSWLIEKAIARVRSTDPAHSVAVMRLAEVVLRDGVQTSGIMADEFHRASGTFSKSAWWVQAEAMVGLATRWAHGGGQRYLDATRGIWRQVQHYYKDHQYGEWHWFSSLDVPPEQSEYKVGAWKAPYHSGRAMMLLSQLLATDSAKP